jgi:uncharacterized membrane protein
MAKQLVLAFFDNESAADAAVTAVKAWDKADKEVKLGAIGVLVKDANGNVKTNKLGARQTGTGAALLGVAAIFTGGLSIIGGALLGGLMGSFFHKGLGMSKDDVVHLSSQLDDGRAAVGILAKMDEAAAVMAKLTELGGVVESYEVTDEAEANFEEAIAETGAGEQADETVAGQPAD